MTTATTTLAGFALATLAAFSLAGMSGTACAAEPDFAYIGTQGNTIAGPRTTWITAHPTLPVVYGVDDSNTYEGSVTAYAVDRASGALKRIDAVPSGGKGTTFLRFDARSSTLFSANYASGSVSSFAVNPDGSVGARVSTVSETGSGPNAKRQASAHAHSANVDPSGRYVLVPDLGADRVFVYGFDAATHTLVKDEASAARTFVAPPGSGPRHLEFGADGRFAYLLTELSAQVLVLRWDATHGTLEPVQRVSITSEGFQGTPSGAEIALSHDGRFAYVENRAENAMQVYRIDPGSGELTLIQRVAAGGLKPWGFGIDAAGRWLLVANQQSGSVTLFGIDPNSGLLTPTQQSAEVQTAVSATFAN